ncbi:tetratricopeptide repeat protein, partial [Nonomuraea sp. NPDC004297]
MTEPGTPPGASASGEQSVAIGGGNSGIVSSGDDARNVQMRAHALGVYQAAGNQIIHNYPPKPEPGQIVEGDIPQRPPAFQPREQLLRHLARLLGDRPGEVPGEQAPGRWHGPEESGGAGSGAVVICAVAGTAGVGKTMLAASYAWACQAAGWPVVAWIAAESTDQIVASLAGLAGRLGERRPDDDAATAAGRAKDWLAATTRPALLVFDNAADVSAVRSWCPATGATRVVITTRNQAFLRAYEPVEVEVFTPEQAAGFLHERTGLTDPDGATNLATELGHLPLALAQAAAVIARLRLGYPGYLELLRTFPIGDYLPAQAGDTYPAGIAHTILLSIAQTEAALPAADRVLPILAVLSPAGVPVTLLDALNDADDPDEDSPWVRVRETLADLADTSLITFSEDGTAVLMHRLVQRVLRERATHHGNLDTVLNQAAVLLQVFNTTVPDGPQLWKARSTVEMLVDQTDTLYRHVHPDSLSADLLYLRACCGWYLDELADLTRAIPLFEQTLADRERVLGADHPDTLTSRSNLASAYQTAGNLGRAIHLHEQVLADQERVLGPDHPDAFASRNNLAIAY